MLHNIDNTSFSKYFKIIHYIYYYVYTVIHTTTTVYWGPTTFEKKVVIEPPLFALYCLMIGAGSIEERAHL